MGNILLLILCFGLMAVGIAGVILPFLPGVPIAWTGLLIYAWATGFQKISLTEVLIFLGLTILAVAIDFIGPMLGAKKYRASKYGILGAFLGGIVGILGLSLWGVIVGPLVGAFLGELISKKEINQALKSGLGTILGSLGGSLVKIVIILIMLGFLIVSLL